MADQLIGKTQAVAQTDNSPQVFSFSTWENLGLTVAEHPTFWLYIPYQFSSPRLVELVLRDENTKKEVYRTQFSIEKGAGIIG